MLSLLYLAKIRRNEGMSMSNRHYVCPSCGALRRTGMVYPRHRHETIANRTTRPEWPKCCNQPMTVLSFVQSEGATQLTAEERIAWLTKGGHVLRTPGKHTWKPVTAEWQIAEAKEQLRGVSS